jgi:hypothetical protein
MRILDSSVGAFAITSLGAHAAASLPYWSMRLMVLRSCISGTVIARGKGCCEYGTVIPLIQDRCSTND